MVYQGSCCRANSEAIIEGMIHKRGWDDSIIPKKSTPQTTNPPMAGLLFR